MRKFRPAMILSFFGALAMGLPAAAQSGGQPAGGPIAFDRPEGWALQYFAAATTFTPLAPPALRGPGAVELALEGGWVPHLSESQRRVGFDGTALEDLNKTPVFARLRAAVGLPGGFTAELGWIPPVERRGAKANLFDAALERPFVAAGPFALGLRLYGQVGHAKGDVTCSRDVAAQPANSPGNPLGCEGPSADTSTLDDAGGALTAGTRLGAAALHAAVGATYDDVQFQVGAVTNGFHDSTLLKTHGWNGWAAAGVDAPVAGPVAFDLEAFYAPLRVRRPPDTSSGWDGLFNVRAAIRVRLP